MAIKEMCSKLAFRKVGSVAIGANQAFTTLGAVIDTKDADFDNTFIVGASAFTDGVYNLQVQEADDAGFTENVAVLDRDHIVGQPAGGVVSITAASTAGAVDYAKVGVFANRRFLRLQVEATGVTTGATIEAFVALGRSIVPV